MLAAHSTPSTQDTLLAELKRRIETDGPISIADYMEACLGDPEFGYYATRDPLGEKGDFTTAPEISQIFGELIGLWCVVVWQEMGTPASVRLIELGPGRGTLMADVLRAAKSVPAFYDACKVHLVETSPLLRDIQAETIGRFDKSPQWHANLMDISDGSAILIANEFFDALPVRQFEKRDGRWFERCVALTKDGKLQFQVHGEPLESETPLPEELRVQARDGDMAEIRPASNLIVETLAARAQKAPTAALFIDYGHCKSAPGDTLQAVRRHDYADPLEEPGMADLTAHVDFDQLGDTARSSDLDIHGPLSQREFLLDLGLKERCERLVQNANAATKETIAAGARRLVDPAQMGELFKVMALTSTGITPPPFSSDPKPEQDA